MISKHFLLKIAAFEKSLLLEEVKSAQKTAKSSATKARFLYEKYIKLLDI